MGEQFEDWAKETFGELTSIAGVARAAGAGLAGATAAAGAAAVEAAHKYAEYVEQIDRASKSSGIGVEEMSKLHYAVQATGGNFESLMPGLESLQQHHWMPGAGWIHDAIADFHKMQEEVHQTAEALEHLGSQNLNAPAAAASGSTAEKTKEDYQGISNVLERLTGELAGFGSEEEQAEEKVHKMLLEMDRALDELRKKQAEGKLAPGVFDREMAAWDAFAQNVPRLYDELMNQIRQRRDRAANQAEAQRREEEQREAEADARESARISKELLAAETGLAAKHAMLDREIDEEEAKQKQGAENYRLLMGGLERLRADGHAKIDAEDKAHFDSELARLEEERKAIEREYETSAERIREQYEADAAKYDAAAEREAKKGRSPEEQAATAAAFAAMRGALYTREQGELQQLHDSRGWQGVFGREFQNMIRENENLMKQWATGTSQGALLVQAALVGLEKQGKQAFDGLAQGMGAGIAHAIVYGGSISKAMKQALAATLESIAAQAMVQGIYATALGFLDLAEGDYEAAGNAFAAAAIFGSVGVAAAVAGRGVAGNPNAPGGGGGGAGAGGAGGSGGGPGVNQFGANEAARAANQAAGYQQGGTAAGTAAGGPHVTVNVMGHVIGPNGVTELCSMINDAVLNRDATLTATNTKTGVQVTQ